MVVHVITNGRAGRGMPSFKGLIDEENIRLVAEFIKEDAPRGLKIK
jgi:mono/diheme cytochrome c family protein